MKLTSEEIAQMLDLSAVQPQDNEAVIGSTVDLAKRFHCHAVFVLPGFVTFVKELLGDCSEITIGGAVGFPSGATTTKSKVFETSELIGLGCRELDMVINIPKLLSSRFEEVETDIRAVVETADGLLVKVILECHYLSPDLIRKGCDLAISAGAHYVKTGTGWAASGATFENVELIKMHVGDQIKIKAAGGIHDLNILSKMYALGASRFGVSLKSAEKILCEQEFLASER